MISRQRDRIRFGLLAGVGTLALLSGQAAAQQATATQGQAPIAQTSATQQPPDTAAGPPLAQKPVGGGQINPSNATASEVVVTGTHIRGVAPVGSSLIAVDRHDIEVTGATTTDEILELQPQIFNFGVSDSQRNGTGGAGNITYGTAINLRGLSPFATLTLLDGHRAVPSGTQGAVVDPSTIPTIMLQRVDIVADGASATYGSDAIAGVVNLILRRNFEGAEAMVRGGEADDYNEYQADFLIGHHWDGGQVTVGFETSYHTALSGESRSFYTSDLAPRGGTDNRVNTCNPGTITYNGVNYAIPAGGVTPATAGMLVAGTQNLCDPLKSEDLLPQQRHYNAALTINQDLTPWLSFFGDAYASDREFERHVPIASGPLTVTNANPYFVAPPGTGATSETVNYSFAGQGLGNTITDHGYSRNYQGTFGFDVKLPHDFRWETSASIGHDSDLDYNASINASSAAVTAALASTNPATALNLFGPNSVSLLRSFDNSLFEAPGNADQYVVDSKIDGSLFNLPGGAVKAAVGYEYEKDTLEDGLIQGTPQNPVILFGGLQHLQRSDNAVYGEVLVPIIGANNSLPFVERLDLDVGLRYTDYSQIGSSTDPKFGLNWTVNSDLKLHASYGTSFRAPALSELTGPVTAVFFQTYASPTGPELGYTLGGGNTGLKPETAITYSLGGDWTPSFLPRFKATLNYYHINYANQISSYLSNLNILQNPTAYGSLITPCPSAACTALYNKYIYGTGPGATPEPVFGPVIGAPPIAVFVNGLEENLATTVTDGVDFTVDYRIPTANWGDFDAGINGTYTFSFHESPTPGAPILEEVNHIGFPLRFRFRSDLQWTDGPLNAVVFVNYENGYTNDLATPVQHVGSYTTVDLHASYDLSRLFNNPVTRGTRIGVDITNLFDTDPPFVNIIPNANGGGGFDPQVASPIGRLVALTLDHKF